MSAQSWGWRHGSEVRRRRECSSHNPHQVAQPPVSPVPGTQTPSSASWHRPDHGHYCGGEHHVESELACASVLVARRKEGSGEAQVWREPGGRSWGGGCEGCCFPVEPSTTCPGVAPPTVGWALPHEPLIKNCPTSLLTAPSYGGVFSVDASSLWWLWVVSSLEKTSQNTLYYSRLSKE